MVELKEDDPDAVEHVLRYIYSGRHNTDRDGEWQLQLEIAKAAQKVHPSLRGLLYQRLTRNQYLLPNLATAAVTKYKNVASKVVAPEEVFAAMM